MKRFLFITALFCVVAGSYSAGLYQGHSYKTPNEAKAFRQGYESGARAHTPDEAVAYRKGRAYEANVWFQNILNQCRSARVFQINDTDYRCMEVSTF